MRIQPTQQQVIRKNILAKESILRNPSRAYFLCRSHMAATLACVIISGEFT